MSWDPRSPAARGRQDGRGHRRQRRHRLLHERAARRAGAHVILACRSPGARRGRDLRDPPASAGRERRGHAARCRRPALGRRRRDCAARAGAARRARAQRRNRAPSADSGRRMRMATSSCSPRTCSATSGSRRRRCRCSSGPPAPAIVSLGSMATRLARLPLDDLQLDRSYTCWNATPSPRSRRRCSASSWTGGCARRAARVASIVVHPGLLDLGPHARDPRREPAVAAERFADNLQAAWTQGRTTAPGRPCAHPSTRMRGWPYYGPRGLTKGVPVLARATRTTRSTRVGARLWPLLEEYSGQTFDLG